MFEVSNEATKAVVYIYGTIGEDWWSPEDSVRAKEFSQTLDSLSPKPLDIRIDSCGGDVYEGYAIAGAIHRYEGETNAYIDGIAASAAAYIGVMADKIHMNEYAMFMIHKAACYTQGNSDELMTTAQRLISIDDAIAGIVSKRTGLSLDEAKSAIAAETWYSAEDAKSAGMCDEIIQTEERMVACVDKAIADRYRNVPQNVQVVDSRQPAQTVENGASHTVPIIPEKTVAKAAIVLGNRVYHRKENNGSE